MMSGTYDAPQQPRRDRDVVEAGRADLHPERREVTLRDDVVAHLTERVLGRRRRPRPAGTLMMRGTLAMIGPLGTPSQSWSIILVASRTSCSRTQKRANESPSGWVQTFQSSSWVREADAVVATKVPVDPRCPGVGARQAVLRGDVGRDHADAAGALPGRPPSRGAGPRSRHRTSRTLSITPLVSASQPFGRSSFRPPMRSKFGWNRPPVTALDLVEDVLAVAEGEEDGRDRAELHPHVAEEQDDVRETRHLEEEGADPGGPRRSLDPHELLGREDERHLVGEAAEPVDAVDERVIWAYVRTSVELLVAAVHVARHRLGR